MTTSVSSSGTGRGARSITCPFGMETMRFGVLSLPKSIRAAPSFYATAATPVIRMQSSELKNPPLDSPTNTFYAPASFANRISAPSTRGSVVHPASDE